MRSVWLLALNDLRLTARDRPAAIWMVLMPIAMMWFFGGMGGGGGSADPPAITLGLVNHDRGWLAEAFVEELDDDTLRFRPIDPADYAGAENKVRTLVIPADFTEQVLAGNQQTLRLEKEPGSNATYGMAAEVHITRAIVRTLGRLVELGTDVSDIERFRALRDRPDLVTVAVTTAGRGRPVPSGRQQSVPGMITFLVMMMTLIYGSVFLTIEKASGMLGRQALLPMTRGQVFAGKLLGRMLMAGGQTTVLILAGRFLFGVSLGRSPAGLVLLLVAYTFAVAGLATLLGAILRTPAQASSVGWITAMVMAALGGCWWPSEVMPRWLWQIAHVLPTAWAMDAFHALISFGQGLDAVAAPVAVLAGFGAVFSAMGARFLRFER